MDKKTLQTVIDTFDDYVTISKDLEKSKCFQKTNLIDCMNRFPCYNFKSENDVINEIVRRTVIFVRHDYKKRMTSVHLNKAMQSLVGPGGNIYN